MTRLPIMPFCPRDFFADTMLLDGETQGIYALMLLHAWNRGGSLPADDKALIRILRIHGNRWNRVKKAVLPFWHIENSELFHRRISRDFDRIVQLQIQNKINGKLGGRPSKTLFSQEATKATGFNFETRSETETKGNNINIQKEDSLNGKKGNGQVYVKRDSKAGEAWNEHAKRVTGKSQVWDNAGGWWFPTQYPSNES
jgi:uncharacterized protein YdaU (DUF1376 family)